MGHKWQVQFAASLTQLPQSNKIIYIFSVVMLFDSENKILQFSITTIGHEARARKTFQRSKEEIVAASKVTCTKRDEEYSYGKCLGSNNEIYEIKVSNTGSGFDCTCPVGCRSESVLCKHVIALLLVQLQATEETPPPTQAKSDAELEKAHCMQQQPSMLMGRRILPGSLFAGQNQSPLSRSPSDNYKRKRKRIPASQALEVSDADLIAQCKNALGVDCIEKDQTGQLLSLQPSMKCNADEVKDGDAEEVAHPVANHSGIQEFSYEAFFGSEGVT